MSLDNTSAATDLNAGLARESPLRPLKVRCSTGLEAKTPTSAVSKPNYRSPPGPGGCVAHIP